MEQCQQQCFLPQLRPRAAVAGWSLTSTQQAGNAMAPLSPPPAAPPPPAVGPAPAGRPRGSRPPRPPRRVRRAPPPPPPERGAGPAPSLGPWDPAKSVHPEGDGRSSANTAPGCARRPPSRAGRRPQPGRARRRQGKAPASEPGPFWDPCSSDPSNGEPKVRGPVHVQRIVQHPGGAPDRARRPSPRAGPRLPRQGRRRLRSPRVRRDAHPVRHRLRGRVVEHGIAPAPHPARQVPRRVPTRTPHTDARGADGRVLCPLLRSASCRCKPRRSRAVVGDHRGPRRRSSLQSPSPDVGAPAAAGERRHGHVIA